MRKKAVKIIKNRLLIKIQIKCNLKIYRKGRKEYVTSILHRFNEGSKQ